VQDMSRRYAKITGSGGYLPEKIVTNHDLEKTVETSHQWIVDRTGIHQRHIAADHETSATMAEQAAREALRNANLSPDALDLIIVATCTPEYTFPSTACQVQHLLGANRAAAFDVSAACAGFIYAMTTANQFIQNGAAKHVLVVGAETLSKITDWTDRTTCVLFGDGAGAVVLSASDKPGILATDLGADGSQGSILYRKNLAPDAKIFMSGRELFKRAVESLVQSSKTLLKQANLTAAAIDWVVPHQANLRIIRMVIGRMAVDSANTIITVDKHANTSAASIPLALHEGIVSQKIKRGQTLLLEGIGGGLAWGGCLLIY
jgi:3-oxoacyl-[acyl-carrier-protein] synthase III